MKPKAALFFRNFFFRQNAVDYRKRIALANGKIRRLILGHFARRYLEEARKYRTGSCKRCGACCKLLFECPYLEYDENGLAVCSIHDRRPLNCRIFPATPADLRDRDLVSPDTKCGFAFDEASFPKHLDIPMWKAVFYRTRKRLAHENVDKGHSRDN